MNLNNLSVQNILMNFKTFHEYWEDLEFLFTHLPLPPMEDY